MDLISKKTRSEFREYFSNVTLRKIECYFDDNDVIPVEIPFTELPSGQRRGLVMKYYAGVDWENPTQVRKILSTFADALSDLADAKDFSYDEEFKSKWLTKLNRFLIRDGYQFKDGKISMVGNSANFDDIQNVISLINRSHFQEYIDRIKNSIEQDPSLAIGSTKELVESTLRTILSEMALPCDKNEDIPVLLKRVQKALSLVPDDVDESKKGSDIIKTLLNNLGQVVVKIAELRNFYGTGHGKEKMKKGLNQRHARLVVGAGITLSTFLLETFDLKNNTSNK
jgi:hypothetical protein